MTLDPTRDTPIRQEIRLIRAFPALRHSPWLHWLGRSGAYAIGAALLTVLSSATAILAPMLLAPAAFGTFALLTTLFQIAGKSDLGLSQLADRELATNSDLHSDQAESIIKARWVMGLFVLVFVMPAIMIIADLTDRLDPLDTALAIFGGTAGMIAGGPISVYRAASQIWEFTASALVFQIGMTFPRLGGLILGGTTGCFIALAIWYGGFTALFARPSGSVRINRASLMRMLRSAFPLFAFSTSWLFYLFANRWISAALSSPEDLGYFAFGANLAYVAIGTLGGIAQVYYPRLLRKISEAQPFACSELVIREAERVGLALLVIVAVTLPFAKSLILIAFPHFVPATETAMLLAISCVPLGVSAWLIPIAIARSSRPWFDTLVTLGPSTLTLLFTMYLGNDYAGIVGQGWAVIASALILSACLACLLFHQKVLAASSALRLMVGHGAMGAILGLTFLICI